MSRAVPRYRRKNYQLPAATGNVWRVRVFGLLDNQMTISTFWYQDGNAPGTGTTVIANALYTAFINNVSGHLPPYLGCLSADWTGTKIVVDSPNNPSLTGITDAMTNAGVGPAGHEPSLVAATLIRYTSTKGQCGRGKVELPAVPSGWVTASKISTPAAYNTFATDMLTALTGGGNTFTPALYSKGAGRPYSGQLFTPGCAPLTAVVANLVLGTVRRRKIGRGK